ncbi:MAG: class I SAM-dependent methyltransferase [Anaerolineae bacterium]
MQNHDALVTEQMAYYRARAGEYDEWFLRQGRYDRGADLNRRWFAEVGEVAAVLERLGPLGNVLELAGGTGLWTQRLLAQATTLTVVDAAPEMIALNRERLGESKARYVQSDVFTWQPDRRYDVVFFSFWLSHVPPERFADFWRLVLASLAPGGRFFLVDSVYEPASIARDHVLEGPEATSVVRRLNDGSEYRIVKVFYEPADLEERLRALGLKASMRRTANFFLYGCGGADGDARS